MLAIIVRIFLIIFLAFIACLFHNLYRKLRETKGENKLLSHLFLWFSIFTGFFTFMQIFWLIQWLQTFGYIITSLSLEKFGIIGSMINLASASLIIPIVIFSWRILKDLQLIKIASGKLKFMLINGDIFKSIKKRLSVMFDDKSSFNILYALGKEEGSSIFEVFKNVKKEGSRDMVLFLTMRLLEAMGLIEKGIMEKDKTGKEFDFTIYGSIEAEGVKSNAPTCYFLSGWLAGALKSLTGLEASAVERECVAKGDPYCRIHVKLSNIFNEIKKG
jgi:predicted hydrocarbon binding protein